MTTDTRIGDLVSQGDLIGNVRESIRANLTLWMDANLGVPSQRPGFRFLEVGPETIVELSERLARHATLAIILTPVAPTVPRAIAVIADELEKRQAASRWPQQPSLLTVDRCPGCGKPTHASESDDEGRCEACIRAAGDAPLLPTEKD